eukprot:768765-Hanusia_phi.AAC.6
MRQGRWGGGEEGEIDVFLSFRRFQSERGGEDCDDGGDGDDEWSLKPSLLRFSRLSRLPADSYMSQPDSLTGQGATVRNSQGCEVRAVLVFAGTSGLVLFLLEETHLLHVPGLHDLRVRA